MPNINKSDINYLSTRPRIRGKVIIDDWHTLLKYEDYKWIHSFEGFDDNEWIARLTSRGEDIINSYDKKDEIENLDAFLTQL